MIYLIDANVIIRFLLGDDEKFLQKSIEIFQQIEDASLQVEIVEGVLMEVFFVLTKFYKLPKQDVISDLKNILALEGVVNSDKIILFETLNLMDIKNIDFVDALICAKSKLQGYGKLSFDKDIEKC